jgi:regulator of sirC expression with transglutaminase-like and TPR domain
VDLTERFAQVVQGPPAALALDEAALLLAAHGDPSVDVTAELARLDDLAAGVTEPTLDGLRRHLFAELGFAGATDDDYYDPRCSYLHEVVARRVGIPITLSVLVIEVGRRLGVPLVGVGMPGHFLVRDGGDPEVFVDPYARGALLGRRDAQVRFHAVRGPGAPFDPAYLEPVGATEILTRMLANLEGVATRRVDRDLLGWVLELRLLLPGAGPEDRRRHAALLATTGRVVEAAKVLESLAEEVGGADAEAALASARRLRARLN